MPLRTNINPSYLLRLAILGLAMSGMTGWCIYDGKVTYPNQQKYFLELQKFTEDHPELGEKQRADAWNEQAAKAGHGWRAVDLKKNRSQYDINSQFVMASVTGLIGAFFVIKLLRNLGCWIEADETGLRSSEKREVKFDQITALNKKKWKKKGIAKVEYEVDGRKNRIVLDDCNYERDSTNAILRHVEAKIGPSKITNGKPEPPIKPGAKQGPSKTTA